MLHLSVPAWGPTTHPSACASSASLFKQTALGFSLTWAPSRASHPASIPALPGRAPGSHPAPLGRQCSSQQPQASLSPCKGQVLWVTVRSCKELIQGEGSCSCVTDGISETAAGHPNQKELEVKCKGSLEPFWMVAGLAAGELGLLGGCQVSSLQGAGGASPALPRAVQSSAGSANAQVPALLPPVLPVHHTLGLVVTQSWALVFEAWQFGYSTGGF